MQLVPTDPGSSVAPTGRRPPRLPARDWPLTARAAFQVYVGSVIGVAAGVLGASVYLGWDEPIAGPNAAALGILVVFLAIGEARPLRWLGRRRRGEVTVSWTFAFAILLLASPMVALVALGLTRALGDLLVRRPRQQAIFNAAKVMLSLAGGSAVLTLFGQRAALVQPSGPSPAWLLAVVLAACTISVCNGALTWGALALRRNARTRPTLRERVGADLWIDGMMLALSPVLVVVARFGLMVLPLVLLTVWAVHHSVQLALSQRHEATHDQLTRLPNRRLFKEQTEAAIDAAERRGRGLAVMILDLDGFKEVNDRLGHHVGDLVLQTISDRFSRASRSSAFVARLGGDEFAVLARSVRTMAEAEIVAAEILATLREPCIVQGLPVSLSASLGIAMYPAHGRDFGELLGRADVAMYVSKDSGEAISSYDDDRDRHTRGRLSLLTELQDALDDRALVLQYQPKVDMSTNQLVGVEALARWEHPTLGLLPPSEFIPMAERTELIEPLTDFVMQAALGQFVAWRDLGFDIPVAVNVSARSLHDRSFPGRVGRMLDDAGVAPDRLEIEITENTVMEDPARTVAVATELRAMGIRLAIDDFGTGYSSLATLCDLPTNSIKIDGRFVTSMATDHGSASVVRATIELAKSLGLETVAEGVEQMAAWDLLRDLGCTTAQGYLIGRPGSAASIIDYLLLAMPSADGSDGQSSRVSTRHHDGSAGLAVKS